MRAIIILILLLVLITGCAKQPKVIIISQVPQLELSTRTQTTGCDFNQWPLPDPECTPGAVYNYTANDICYPGYSKEVRNVPESLKNQIYVSYNINSRQPYEYEIDHLIPLSIGGKNDASNLWPEKYNATLGARVKDKVENCLHDRVCKGNMTLIEAQNIMAHNWTKAMSLCGVKS